MSKNVTQKEIYSTLELLKDLFPAGGAMELETPYKTLVGVLLSARTRDEQVLKLLPAFFHRFPNTKELAVASVDEIRSYIDTIGMFRQKAKHLKAMAERVEDVYDGVIPDTMEDLTTLAGVGRKTASVILPHIFGTPAIAVDTHVHRVTNRLEWVKTDMPEKTEKALLELVPQEIQTKVNQVFVKFGRYICLSPHPRCWMCPLVDQCPYKQKYLEEPKNSEEIKADIVRREEVIAKAKKEILES